MSNTGNLTTILIIMLIMDVLFLFVNSAVTDLNPARSNYFRYNQSFISDVDSGGFKLNQTAYNNVIPETESGVTTTGNMFTDVFRTIKGWFSPLGKAWNFFIRFLGGPITYLVDMGAPSIVIFGLGSLWYLMSLWLLLMLLFGRG